MLDRMLEYERRRAISAILDYYRERYHPYAALVPNGRFGIYAAAREMLAPADRVALSPITCGTVVEALLAADVVPVFVDIEPETGNIDISKLPVTLLRSVRAIITTNLYGNPDRAPDLAALARRYGLLLIEDCAHVLETSIGGRRVGSFGDISIFSFKKYFDEAGGIVTFRDPEPTAGVIRRIAGESDARDQAQERRAYGKLLLRRIGPSRVAGALARFRPHGKDGHRPDAIATRPVMPDAGSLIRVASLLRRQERLAAERIAAVRELASRCPLAFKTSGFAESVCHLVAPFLTAKRDEIVASLARRGIPTYFRYTPPMNELFTGQAESPEWLNRDLIRWWCDRILPINPRYGSQYLEAISALEGR